MFKKILVANRGEIAIRVFRACTELGISTVAIYSHEDRLSIHRYKADEAWRVGTPGKPREAYLDIDAIVALAQERGVDAIHPGYGFLSENPDFARACEAAGITFIGPPPSALDTLGDKVSARNLAIAAEVPVIPGTDEALPDAATAQTWAGKVGYPVMLKAAFGGGGRGMRRCDSDKELKEAFEAATREAAAAFGRGDIFLEKFIERPRHIEIQVLGDGEGQVVHLFERDCSIQRRNQKVVEVAPAVDLQAETAAALYRDALKVARAAGLKNAATVEFLVEPDGRYYFIEVNPRVQVEHTITELITGVDIVHAQIHIASGKALSHPDIGITGQDSIEKRGAAIQARVTTEDPRNNFAPDTGRLTAYRSAAGFGIRLDVGVGGAGSVVTPYYDSLLVKVTAFGLTHEIARKKLARSLQEFRIRGVATNLPFLDNIIAHPTFQQGKADTGFVARTQELFNFPRRKNRATRMLRALAETIVNGPPGVEGKPTRPRVTIQPQRPPRLPAVGGEDSFKRILDDKGPAALADRVKGTDRLLITDTTFRDAHQSLLATRMRTDDMVRIARATEARLPGLFSLECWGGATFDVAFRFLRENPWSRLRALRRRMPNTLLQMLLRGSNAVGYTNYPENVVRRFVQLAAEDGIDVFRIFDCFNQLPAMRIAIDEVRQANKVAEVSICYTSDLRDESRPLYNLDYYRRKAAEVCEAGAHMVAIKDMAGLLKPGAAEVLVDALKKEVDVPLHIHTHDTSGNGVAMLLAAAGAGADVVDGALASMSGLTSQPSLDALCASLAGTPRDPGFDAENMQALSDYWEAVRTWYEPFESGLRASTADVYRHEIPGGQYSNLKPQALAVGLSEKWNDVRERYREVNFGFGDLIKVTPSSKVVGDFALWLVRQEMTFDEFMQSSETFDVPQSVIGFFEGAIGIPEGGFPDEVRQRVLGPQAAPAPTEPAALSMEPYDFEAGRKKLEALSDSEVSPELEVSHALYPNVIENFLRYRNEFGDTAPLDTETFFYGLTPDREITVSIEPGKSLVIEHRAVGALREDGSREVHFMLNGQPRSVVVVDKHAGVEVETREKADPTSPDQVGAPMPGNVLSVAVQAGGSVEEGDALMVLEAMKLETTVRAPRAGKIGRLTVKAGDKVEAKDLLVVLE